jgi:hypothetical protein
MVKIKNIKALPKKLRVKKVKVNGKLGSKFARDSKQALKVGKKINTQKIKLKRPKLDFQK